MRKFARLRMLLLVPILLFALVSSPISFASPLSSAVDASAAAVAVPAFPGAQGSGAIATGGRGGAVIMVTHTNDAGPGSLRACVDASGPRTCIFRTGGTITLKSPLRPKSPGLTIAGQTAPGGGIQLKGKLLSSHMFVINTTDVVIRYIKFRKGFHPDCAGGPGNECGGSLIWGVGAGKTIIDHTSTQWTQDESLGFSSDGEDSTVSNSITAEPLRGHPTGWAVGGFSPTVSAKLTNIDWHHNLLTNSSHRNPLLRGKSGRLVSNIFYNKRLYFAHVSGGMSADFIGNKWKRGPLEGRPGSREVEAGDNLQDSHDAPGTPSIYMKGNIGPNQSSPSGNQFVMTCRIAAGGENNACGSPTTPIPAGWQRSTPLPDPTYPIVADPVTELDSKLLGHVGASRRLDCDGSWVPNRDSVDARQVTQYQNGTGIDPTNWPVTEDGYGGYPTLAAGTPCTDSDLDGMPNVWETANGLNPNNPADRNGIAANGYTNLENYLNGAPSGPPADDKATKATMAAYWNGTAAWVYLRKQPGADYHDGIHVEAMSDGTWYYFNRKYVSVPGCLDNIGMGTQVRKSTNKGATWTAPVAIFSPTANTPWSCYATDGDAWYNSTENKWHYLFQCYDNVSWKGCELSRAGADPMGAFTIQPSGNNPVITSGEIWNQVCDVSTDDCSRLAGGPGRVHDEGTFNIFRHDGTHYWVAFHGYDGTRGYRGIAKTSNFQNWIAGNSSQGVPADAVHDPDDSQPWRESWSNNVSIGGGHGSILQEGSYYYHLIEGADINLACSLNQTWDYGLYRSTSLTATSWSQLPAGNPIIYSSKGETGDYTRCNVQYAGLFKDPTDGFIYLTYRRRSADPNYDATYWYRLENTSNLLVNSDLWRADAYRWNRIGSATNLAIYRLPNNSPDGTPYLATNCGGTCTPGQSIYQDVSIPGGTSGTLEFGGKFMSEGSSGSLDLVVHQMDSSYNVLRTDVLPVSTGTSWAAFGTSAPLLSTTRILRYEFYLKTSVTYRADDMYLMRLSE